MPENIDMILPPVAAGVYCPICGVHVLSKRPSFESKDGYPLYVCEGVRNEHCPVMLSFPWESEEEYNDWYKDGIKYHNDEQYNEGQRSYFEQERHESLKKAAESRWSTISPLLIPPSFRGDYKLLDIGAGAGEWVDYLVGAAGIDAVGYEPNPKIKEMAKHRYRIFTGSWSEIHHEPVKGFDCITLLDVFEHLTRPAECLKRCYELTKPGGHVVIETPEFAGFHYCKYGRDWKHIRPRQHVCLYSEGALTFMAHLLGFETVFTLLPLNGSLGKMTIGLYKPGEKNAETHE